MIAGIVLINWIQEYTETVPNWIHKHKETCEKLLPVSETCVLVYAPRSSLNDFIESVK